MEIYLKSSYEWYCTVCCQLDKRSKIYVFFFFVFVSILLQLKMKNLSVFFSFFFLASPLRVGSPLARTAAIHRDSTLLSPVKGCRDCVGSRVLQLAFFHLSAGRPAEMTDGRELRADGGPQRGSRLRPRRTKEEDGERTRWDWTGCCEKRRLLIVWRSVSLCFCFFPQECDTSSRESLS